MILYSLEEWELGVLSGELVEVQLDEGCLTGVGVQGENASVGDFDIPGIFGGRATALRHHHHLL